jgi:hypothetical protein
MSEGKRKILVGKIEKRGVSRTFGSGFGFGSWTIGETSIEIQLDPPIDLTTAEGQEQYKKIKVQLYKMCQRALDEDIQEARKTDKELNASIVKREMLVNNSIENE